MGIIVHIVTCENRQEARFDPRAVLCYATGLICNQLLRGLVCHLLTFSPSISICFLCVAEDKIPHLNINLQDRTLCVCYMCTRLGVMQMLVSKAEQKSCWPGHFPPYFLETGSLSEPGARLEASKPQGSSCLCLPQLQGYRLNSSLIWLFTWVSGI